MDDWNDFLSALRQAPSSFLFETLDFVRAAEVSMHMEMCPLQDPLRFRACFLARRFAEAIVDESGHLSLDRARALREELGQALYWTGPRLEDDHWILEHIYRALGHLVDDEAIAKKLRSFAPPVCNQLAEQIIRQTLWPTPIARIETAHVLKAVLTAWFTWLRQITGSCFATAPAIVIQREQPMQFLADLQELLVRGGLRRVIEGRDYVVPLCPAVLHSDLLRPLAVFKARGTVALAPGLIAALSVARVFPPGLPMEAKSAWLQAAMDAIIDVETPKQWIEEVLLWHLGIGRRDVEDEAAAERLQMAPMLAKQSAIYYQRESPRAKKVARWKEEVSLAFSAYQALADCALLRAWESTLASFSDVKVEFARWNLFVSLGIDHNQPFGVGAILYSRIEAKLQEVNQQIALLHQVYEEEARTVEVLEMSFRGSVDEMQRHQLKAEWTGLVQALHQTKREIDELAASGEQLSQLFAYMLQWYDRRLQESFQEIFDPSLAHTLSEMMDDSPAGFRLAYKHGHLDAALWTFISDEEMFVRALVEFFSTVEKEMIEKRPELAKVIEQLSTELIQAIQTTEFMQGALARVGSNRAIQRGYKKPWEYISGGSVDTLLTVYYQRNHPSSVLQAKIATPLELLHFLIECKQRGGSSSVMSSPMHAFVFQPENFPEDALARVDAMRLFWQSQRLAEDEEEQLVELYSDWLPKEERLLFVHRQRQLSFSGEVKKFRERLMDGHEARAVSVDSFLYESIPGRPAALREQMKREKYHPPIGAVDWDARIAADLRREGRAAPEPIFFGDTNWTAGRFALAVSPNGELHVWRFQRTGMTGSPMEAWFRNQQGGIWVFYP